MSAASTKTEPPTAPPMLTAVVVAASAAAAARAREGGSAAAASSTAASACASPPADTQAPSRAAAADPSPGQERAACPCSQRSVPKRRHRRRTALRHATLSPAPLASEPPLAEELAGARSRSARLWSANARKCGSDASSKASSSAIGAAAQTSTAALAAGPGKSVASSPTSRSRKWQGQRRGKRDVTSPRRTSRSLSRRAGSLLRRRNLAAARAAQTADAVKRREAAACSEGDPPRANALRTSHATRASRGALSSVTAARNAPVAAVASCRPSLQNPPPPTATHVTTYKSRSPRDVPTAARAR
mmetsp:Transcript_8189/g.25890  ORF Transcript_8189/g.25890 Transcript_8189/m.25890 type:complete len:303 (+) Transcript_8189:678-1586(+)